MKLLDTASGKRVDLDAPRPEQIELSDIAGGLSRICRFGAQSFSFYSVAQHAVLVASLVEAGPHPELALAALHHDSHEAFACDLPTPLKDRINAESNGYYDALCCRLDDAIDARFGILGVRRQAESKHVIKEADNQALLIEAHVLLHDGGAGLRADRELAAGVAEDLPLLGELLLPAAAEEAFTVAHLRLAGHAQS